MGSPVSSKHNSASIHFAKFEFHQVMIKSYINILHNLIVVSSSDFFTAPPGHNAVAMVYLCPDQIWRDRNNVVLHQNHWSSPVLPARHAPLETKKVHCVRHVRVIHPFTWVMVNVPVNVHVFSCKGLSHLNVFDFFWLWSHWCLLFLTHTCDSIYSSVMVHIR